MKWMLILISTLVITSNVFGQQKNVSRVDSILRSEIIKADMIIETDTRGLFKNLESFIVYSKGETIFEKYYNGASKDSVHQIQSQTKSIVALLLGIAIDKGYITSEDDPVARYFPDSFRKEDGMKSAVTIKDLLTMSAGFEWEEMLPLDDPKNDNMNMFRSGRWLRYALSRPMARKPFSEFKYNSGCPMIVAGIIENTTAASLDKFAEKYLFRPLGIVDYRWIKDSTGFCHAGGGLFIKPSDMVKIGILILNKGKYDNRQIVSENWLQKVSQPYFVTPLSSFSYGYFWWIKNMKISEEKTTKVLSAQGAGGQHLYVFPEYNLVVSVTEHNFGSSLVGPMIISNAIVPSLK